MTDNTDRKAVERVKTYLDARRKLLLLDGGHIHGIGNGKGGVTGLNASDVAALLAAKESAEAERDALRERMEAIYEICVEPEETDHESVRRWIEVESRNALDQPKEGDSRICQICDGGPGNEGPCLCGHEKWEGDSDERR